MAVMVQFPLPIWSDRHRGKAGAWGRVSKPDPAEASVGPEAGEPQSRVFSYAAAAARGAAKSKSGKGGPVPKAA